MTSNHFQELIQNSFKVDPENESPTFHYITKERSIPGSIFQLLEAPLLEIEHEGIYSMYELRNKNGDKVGVNYRQFKAGVFEKRYGQGSKKSSGVAILRKKEKMILSEGLETGLSVLSYLGTDYGLAVCGDADNLYKISTSLSWVIKDASQVYIAADNDINSHGLMAGRSVLHKYPNKCQLFVPEQTGDDWNDVLKKGRMKKEWY